VMAELTLHQLQEEQRPWVAHLGSFNVEFFVSA